MVPNTYRKSVRHVDVPGQIHELTFSCQERRALLDDPVLQRMLVAAIDQAIQKHGFELLAFVLMPEHVHLIVRAVGTESQVSRLLYAIKKPVSERYRRWLEVHDPVRYRSLVRTDGSGRTGFRLWLKGPGYDRNVIRPGTARAAIDYVHGNPVRRGLCRHPGEWLWSSWGFYHGERGRPEVEWPELTMWEGC